MNNTALVYDETCLRHDAGPGHPECPERLQHIVAALRQAGLWDACLQVPARLAATDDLLRVHSADHIDRIDHLSGMGGLVPETPDTVVSAATFRCASLASGGVTAAVDAVVDGPAANALCLHRPPGHHAERAQAMGFCYFNHVAVGARYAQKRHGLGKIAIIDWDVHHGNGTQHAFYERDDVLTISLHQEGCFPPGYSGAEDRGAGAGEGFNINIPLLPGGGHAAYEYAMARMVEPAIRRFDPDLIIVASGFDAGGFDPLARMLLHSESYRALARRVLALADAHCDGRVVVVHEGGYAESYVPFCVHAVVEELAGESMNIEDPALALFQAQQPNARVTALQQTLIDEMADAHGL